MFKTLNSLSACNFANVTGDVARTSMCFMEESTVGGVLALLRKDHSLTVFTGSRVPTSRKWSSGHCLMGRAQVCVPGITPRQRGPQYLRGKRQHHYSHTFRASEHGQYNSMATSEVLRLYRRLKARTCHSHT